MSVFLLRLKRETWAHHTNIERQVDLRRICGSRLAYSEHLARLYGFYQPLEKALWRTDAVRDWRLGKERQKTPLLFEDLSALRIDPHALPLCHALPTLVEDAQVLGCLYVLEGASLGGQVITRVVRDRLGIGPDNGGAFFYGYGSSTTAMWDGFRNCLEVYAGALNPEGQEALIVSACATFDTLGKWLSLHQGRADV